MKDNRRRRGVAKLKIIPLGGLNEIGKNMTLLCYEDNILIIDCGMSFPEDGMYGIDIVLPDFNYLEENRRKVRGIILTHGHEDHIGALPYFLKDFHVPVYGTPLTLGLVRNKLEEHNVKAKLKTINDGSKFKTGPFEIETIRTTHSVADAVCFSIKTPVGRIFHTGDFKIDFTPVDGEPIDMQKLAEIGRKGVLLMMADSTNAIRPGFTASEKVVGETLDNIFAHAKNRIIISTFSSNVNRLQKIVDTSVKYSRKVAITGRSLEKVVKTAIELGYLKVKPDVFVNIKEAGTMPDKKVTIITTGSQGEPMSALSRMANNEHKSVRIKKDDIVILSSTPVPGNEKMVSSIVNTLIEKGAKVIYSDIAETHVSGHARAEELKIMHSLIRPRFFMPVHGEALHLQAHKSLAIELGMREKDVFMLNNGNILELTHNSGHISDEKVSSDDILVDGLGVGDVGEIVLRDRKLLSESGIIMAVFAVDKKNKTIVSGPEIITRGFVYVRENEDMIHAAQEIALNAAEKKMSAKRTDWNAVKQNVRDELRRFIYKRTEREPVILPIILDV